MSPLNIEPCGKAIPSQPSPRRSQVTLILLVACVVFIVATIANKKESFDTVALAVPEASQRMEGVGPLPDVTLPRQEPRHLSSIFATTSKTCPSFPAPEPLPGKKGICFTLRPEGKPGSWVENMPLLVAVEPYWNYAWGTHRVDAQPAGIEYVPMLWGAWSNNTLPQLLNQDVVPLIESGVTKRFLGYNEPDNTDQSNMAVDWAVQLWPYLEGLGVSLVSPSCVSANGAWMESFMRQATEQCLRIDWIGVHWYGGPNAASFKHSMQSVYQKFGKPLLITEFAPADWNAKTVDKNKHTRAKVLDFAKQILPWMEAQDWIAGYAWYSFQVSEAVGTSSALFDASGKLTPLGLYYASVTNENPQGDQSIQV